jgi:hypothetical protein
MYDLGEIRVLGRFPWKGRFRTFSKCEQGLGSTLHHRIFSGKQEKQTTSKFKMNTRGRPNRDIPFETPAVAYGAHAARQPTGFTPQDRVMDTQETFRTIGMTQLTQQGVPTVTNLASNVVKEFKQQFGSAIPSATSSILERRQFFERLKPKLHQKCQELDSEQGKINMVLQVVQTFAPTADSWVGIEIMNVSEPYVSLATLWKDIGEFVFQVVEQGNYLDAEKVFQSLQFSGLSDLANLDFEVKLLQAGLKANLTMQRIREKYFAGLTLFAEGKRSWHWLTRSIQEFFFSHENHSHCFQSNSLEPMSREDMSFALRLVLRFRSIMVTKLQASEKDFPEAAVIAAVTTPAKSEKTVKFAYVEKRTCKRCNEVGHIVKYCPIKVDNRTEAEKAAQADAKRKREESNPYAGSKTKFPKTEEWEKRLAKLEAKLELAASSL